MKIQLMQLFLKQVFHWSRLIKLVFHYIYKLKLVLKSVLISFQMESNTVCQGLFKLFPKTGLKIVFNT